MLKVCSFLLTLSEGDIAETNRTKRSSSDTSRLSEYVVVEIAFEFSVIVGVIVKRDKC
jgi:hypothetical protein